jgi:small conductance mechanosensitive channel
MISFLLSLLPYVEAILIALIGNFLIKKYSDKLVHKLTAKMKIGSNIQTIACIAAKFVLYFLLITSICPLVGISNASLVTLLGTFGAAAALATQNGLSNIVGGVFLMVTDAFSVGDWVDAAGKSGTVVKVGLFFTELMTGDNHLVYIPNSSLTSATVENYSRTDKRRLDLDIGVPYTCKLADARKVIEDCCKADARVLADPAPFVRTWDLNDSSVNIKVRVWCEAGNYWELRSSLTENIKEALDANNMSVPFNILDVNLFQQK